MMHEAIGWVADPPGHMPHLVSLKEEGAGGRRAGAREYHPFKSRRL
jgi:hypothetical protein